MNVDSKIYVAGHCGMVGSAILRQLQEKGYKNIIGRESSKLDLRRQQATEEFFAEERPEYVFLAAAKVGGILANSTYKAEFIYDNIMIAANVISAAHKYNVKKLLNLGSACIYPKFAPQPMKEDYLLTGSLEPTNEPYSIAKIAAIKLCRYYNEQYAANFISAMPINLYGPGDNFNLETGHVIPSVMRKFYLAKFLQQERYDLIVKDIKRYSLGFNLDGEVDLDNKESVNKILADIGVTKEAVTLWGSGQPYREFLFVDDLADACLFLMDNYDYKDIGEFINIGAGRDLRINKLAEITREIVGFDGDIIWDNSRPDGTPRKHLDISRIKKLGWEPKMDLHKGIETTYVWVERRLAG